MCFGRSHCPHPSKTDIRNQPLSKPLKKVDFESFDSVDSKVLIPIKTTVIMLMSKSGKIVGQP